jgi:hypothetical protein
MRKIFLTGSLFLALVVPGLAGDIPITGFTGETPIAGFAGDTPISGLAGETPIAGYAGCENGLYYPETGICCLPGEECPAGRAAPEPYSTSFIKFFLQSLF